MGDKVKSTTTNLCLRRAPYQDKGGPSHDPPLRALRHLKIWGSDMRDIGLVFIPIPPSAPGTR